MDQPINNPVDQSSYVQTVQTPEMATFWARFFAGIIDGFVIMLLNLAFYFMLASIEGSEVITNLLSFVLGFAYTFGLLISRGQTVGRMAMHIKVVKDTDYGPLTFIDVLLREVVGKALSSILAFAGYAAYFLSPKRQTWHDKIAGTLVVKLNPSNEINFLENNKYDKKVGSFIAVMLVFVSPIILGILAGIFLAMLNPAEQMERAREAARQSMEQKQALEQEMDNAYRGTPVEKSEEIDMDKDLSELIADFRSTNGLPDITQSFQLCSYASKRVDDMETLGEFDDDRGFYEDVGNADMKGYFAGYEYIGELYLSLDNTEEVVRQNLQNSWFAEDSNLADPKFTEGCIRNGPSHLVMIVGSK